MNLNPLPTFRPLGRTAALLLGLLAAGSLQAQDGAPAPAAPEAAAEGQVGHSTRAWMELQRSNRQAGRSHPVPGEVASATWKRYVDSFRMPVGTGAASPSAVTGTAAAVPSSTGGSSSGGMR